MRHRVRGYQAGDLEKKYAQLDIEEDFLYAYGFVPRAIWRLLHPRIEKELSALERQVLAIVSAEKCIHPRDLEAHLGSRRELNAWGGYSKATTRALQALHYRGLLRIAERENGIRLYEATSGRYEAIEPEQRLRQLIVLITRIFAPIPERSLRATLQHLGHGAPALHGRHSMLTALLESGELANADCEGIRYVWPNGRLIRKESEPLVRFLAPFDPLVWDRRRFEQLWGWSYRLEAYTPAAKRKLGYYAMPMLWRDVVVGWVNARKIGENLNLEAGFVNRKPTERAFQGAFDNEVERFRIFLSKR